MMLRKPVRVPAVFGVLVVPASIPIAAMPVLFLIAVSGLPFRMPVRILLKWLPVITDVAAVQVVPFLLPVPFVWLWSHQRVWLSPTVSGILVVLRLMVLVSVYATLPISSASIVSLVSHRYCGYTVADLFASLKHLLLPVTMLQQSNYHQL